MTKYIIHVSLLILLVSITLPFAQNGKSRFPVPDRFVLLSTETPEPEQKTPSVNIQQNSNLMTIKKGRNMAIAGTILYFTGVAVEWPVYYPWAKEISDKAKETDDPGSEDFGDAFLVLLATIPIGALEISGPLIACIGAHKSRRAQRLTGLTKSRKTNVWKPYIIGWILAGVGAGIGAIGGLAEDERIENVGTGFGIGSEVAWSVATIWALVETSKTYKSVSSESSSVSIVPYYSKSGNGTGGIALNVSF
jgi:hypothetical protein